MEIIEGTYEAIFGFPKVDGIYMQAKFFGGATLLEC